MPNVIKPNVLMPNTINRPISTLLISGFPKGDQRYTAEIARPAPEEKHLYAGFTPPVRIDMQALFLYAFGTFFC